MLMERTHPQRYIIVLVTGVVGVRVVARVREVAPGVAVHDGTGEGVQVGWIAPKTTRC